MSGRWLVLWIGGVALLIASSGCSSLYRHSVETEAFTLYGDNDPDRLQRLATVVGATIRDYRSVFALGDREIPPPRVVYEEDNLSAAGIYTSEMRQEGFYLPLLRLVHLSPRHYSELANDLHDAERVVRHELAHHFLIQLHPASGSRYWLNEGVACALEAPLLSTDSENPASGHVAPLYHQWLHEQAHLALMELGREKFGLALRNVLDSGWFGFHQSGSKVRNYALSWAFTYFQLRQMQGSFAQNVQTLVGRPQAELEAHVPRFLTWLELDPNLELDTLAERPELRPWVLQTWLNLTRIDGPRFLKHLLPMLLIQDEVATHAAAAKYAANYAASSDGPTPPEPPTAATGSAAPDSPVALLARLLNRPVIGSLPRQRLIDLRTMLAERLSSDRDPHRLAIAQAIRRSGYFSGYFRPLVALLESENEELRVASARALARLSEKPTITRPGFWRQGSHVARAAEVLEWQTWLDVRGL